MNNAPAPKSNAPMLIIGAVLLIVIIGGWWFYSSSKTGSAGSNVNGGTPKPANTAKAGSIPANAPIGANPPNQAGSQSASVTLEEFADFQCPQCAASNPIMSEIKSMYGTRIRFIFRNYPLQIPAHDKSYEAAVAAEAAGSQSPNKFWEMQNLLFTNQQAWTAAPTYKQIWKGYAEKIGLDVNRWENDMAGITQAKQRVDADMARGKAIGVNSTPSLFINGVPIDFKEMKVDSLKALIDAEIQKTTPQSAAPASGAANTAPAAETSNTNK